MHLTTSLTAICLASPLLLVSDSSAPTTSAPVVGPVCNAGGPYVGECQNGVATVQLDGTASFDPDGQPLEFLWFIECGSATITNPRSATPTVSIVMNDLCDASCGRLDLFVRNPQGQVSKCGTSLSFQDSMPPQIVCPPDLTLTPTEPTDPSYTGTATATDLCHPSLMVTWSDDYSTGPNGETIITRTWAVDDGCDKDACDQIITIEEQADEPGLDIKPTSCPNPFQVNSNGVMPVALTGAAGFDVSLVDVTTLSLSRNDGVGGSVAPLANQVSVADTATPFAGDLCDCHTFGGDGVDDLNLKFDEPVTEAALQLGSVPNMTTIQLDLSGMLLDGTPFTASDCIRVQGT